MNTSDQDNPEFDTYSVMKLMPRQQQNLTLSPDVRLKLRMLSILMNKPMNKLVEDLIDAMWDIHQNDKVHVKLSRKERKRIGSIIAGTTK